MEINPKLNLDAFEASFHAIDTHTVGEFTRIITSGFPKLEGDTMIERKNFLQSITTNTVRLLCLSHVDIMICLVLF